MTVSQQEDVFLMFVDVKNGIQSNKFYNMYPSGTTFRVEYGRVGSSKTELTYSMRKWDSTYRSKIKKGYEDISHLKKGVKTTSKASGNKAFDEFFKVFSKYTGDAVASNYLGNSCTQEQMDEAQSILDGLTKKKTTKTINEALLKLYKVIPRQMRDVNDHLVSKPAEKKDILAVEQDALDSMDSSSVVIADNPFKSLDIEFKVASSSEIKMLEELIYPTRGYHSHVKIHRAYSVKHKKRTPNFDKWVKKQKNKKTEYLIHGTRNANVLSILKQGLRIRPTNAAVISGAAYGNGIYHSAHTAKSLNYVGRDTDKVFLIQNVHMGKPYTYSGWYRSGKDLDYSDLNYKGLQKQKCDSLFVKPGDGLLNSEYIVYNEDQTDTQYLVWLK